VITLGKIAGGDATPREDFAALLPLLTRGDDDILIEDKNLERTGYFSNFKELRKTTDEVGCLNTLMKSIDEFISVHFARKLSNVN